MSPKPIPVAGPPNLVQNQALSMEFLKPASAFLTIWPESMVFRPQPNARFWNSLSILEKIRMIYALGVSVVGIDDVEIDVEELKKQDMITLAMEEFRKFSPKRSMSGKKTVRK